MAVKTVPISCAKARLEVLRKLERPFEDGEAEEYQSLEKLARYLNLIWHSEKELVRVFDFTEHAMELLYQRGDLKKGGIADGLLDHEAAAEQLEDEFWFVNYDGEPYCVSRL